MKVRFLYVYLSFLFVNIYVSAFTQENNTDTVGVGSILDSLRKSGIIFNSNQTKPEIILSTSHALEFLQEKFHPQLWNNTHDPLRQAFGQLIFQAALPPFDSLRKNLLNYPYDSLSISWDKFYIWEPVRLRIPVISRPEFNLAEEFKDTTIMVIIDTLNEVTSSYSGFPFKYFNSPFQGDSIKAAVESLLKYLDERDSSLIRFTGIGKAVTPIMLNSKSEKVMRYWLKNEFSDSLAIWIGNPSRNTISLYLEHGVNFRRPVRQGNYADANINIKSVDNSKRLSIQNIAVKSQFWKYRTEASFVLSQAALTNWVKGGENSISTSMDITYYADYNNKPLKISSNNFVRLKLGFLKSGDNPVRKNIDLLETNSKLNHKAFGRFDFSAILLFKTQIAEGKYYFKTVAGKEASNVVSKFMNPAILTIGFGLDYKPDKTTSLNFSPLSYKGTFITDPAYYNQTYDSTRIDQTKYGIAKNRKSLNEPGASFMISNEFRPVKNVVITNRLQLFTNYINKPLNIDVDWEMIAVINLNWFTDVRFNTHLIFDDDTRTQVLDKDRNPVIRPDGTMKKTARIQFKEMLGFSFVFRF